MRSLFSVRFFLLTSLISFGYLFLNVYLTNSQVINQAFLQNFSLTYKFNLISSLFVGLYTATSLTSFLFLILISLLTGINLTLALGRVNFAKNRMHFAVGGSFLGGMGSGCASCGLPLLGVLGLSGSVTYLPLRGLEFSIVSLSLLVISFFVLLRTPKECKI